MVLVGRNLKADAFNRYIHERLIENKVFYCSASVFYPRTKRRQANLMITEIYESLPRNVSIQSRHLIGLGIVQHLQAGLALSYLRIKIWNKLKPGLAYRLASIAKIRVL